MSGNKCPCETGPTDPWCAALGECLYGSDEPAEDARPKLSERQICDWVWQQVRAGERRFDSGEVCPYAANTLHYMLDVLGWCYQDQRRAHMRHNPAYRAEQERIEKAMMENGK